MPTATKARPRNVYLDQSVYSQFLNESRCDWRDADSAQVLLEAQRDSHAQVWASPTHVLETCQTTDLDRRAELASVILHLIEARRMWHGHEIETVHHFAQFLKACAPNFVRYPEFLRDRVRTTRRTWLGALALIAAAKSLPLEPLVASLRKVKATSQLLHARFAVNPRNWVDGMIRTVNEQLTTRGDPFSEFERLTVEEMEVEIAALEPEFEKLQPRDLARLNKERADLAHAYGAIEVGRILDALFTLPCEIELTFDIPHLVECWPSLQAKTGCKPLSSTIVHADMSSLMGDRTLVRTVLQQAIFAVCKVGLIPSTVAFDVILRDLQKCINDRRLPTGGLTFDANHAVSLIWCDIFVTYDQSLGESAKTMAKLIEAKTNGTRRIDVVTTPEQLRRALARPANGALEHEDISVELGDWGSA